MVHRTQQAIRVRRKVDTDDIGTLVRYNVEEAGVLVREAVVILSPDSGRQQDVERRHLDAPFDFEALLDPFAVLVYHTVDDVDEGFVAVEEAVASGEDIPF
jgi:hypothetical protein